MGGQKSAEGIVAVAHGSEGPNLLENLDQISDCLEQMPRKRALKSEVVDGIHELRLGAYRTVGMEVTIKSEGMNRRMPNGTYGGVRGGEP